MSVYKPNNDHELKTVFTENLPIIKFVSHDVFEDNDWKDFIQQCPDGADPFDGAFGLLEFSVAIISWMISLTHMRHTAHL